MSTNLEKKIKSRSNNEIKTEKLIEKINDIHLELKNEKDNKSKSDKILCGASLVSKPGFTCTYQGLKEFNWKCKKHFNIEQPKSKIEKQKNKPTIIDFDNLESQLDNDCYTKTYIPVISKTETIDETGLEEKFGGHVPFFIEGEKWPLIKGQPTKLVCQFKDPRNNNNILFRFFSNIDEEDVPYCEPYFVVLKIELNEQNLKKQIFLKPNSLKKPYTCHQIISWEPKIELKSPYFILNKYGYTTMNQFNSIIVPEKYNEYEIKFIDIYEKLESQPYPNIKVGGTPKYCQYNTNIKECFLQLTKTNNYHPYGWGDCGIAHIDEEGNLDWDCF
jgi:hypothetical protein